MDIEVDDPTTAVNIVVPVDHINVASGQQGGPITNNTQNGKLGWPRVTTHENGIDTITGVAGQGYGLFHALRTDSLLKYLEKPANASWEIEFDGGAKRADLRTGDKLLVTAENGDVKEYFIEVQGYVPNHNANLSSITWPDISLDDFYKEIFGWIGDTIPTFNPSSTNYRVTLPYDFDGMPALVSKTEDLNASVAVKRATSFEGGVEERTTSFEVTAEDDSVTKVYNVELVKEKDPENLQPYHADPFVSEFVRAINKNGFVEICNPGNQPLDLSHYLIASSSGDNPADAITQSSGEGDWNERYNKYIPGRKWLSELDWQVTPGRLQQSPDLAVNALVQPGDVFLMGEIFNDKHVLEEDGYAGDGVWDIPGKLEVQFRNQEAKFNTYSNP